MPTILSHAVVAVAAARAVSPAQIRTRFWLLSAVCSVLPDLDVVAFRFGIPYHHVLGHRGVSHSLALAAVVGAIAVFAADRGIGPSRKLRAWIFFAAVTASHGLLDAMTTGGLGVAFFAPFSNERYFLPLRPIPVSPIGAARFMSARGVAVLSKEVLILWLPSAILAGTSMLVWRLSRTGATPARLPAVLSARHGAGLRWLTMAAAVLAVYEVLACFWILSVPRSVVVASNRNEPMSKRLIIIDAGHGGAEAGARSISGRFEKELTLKLSGVLHEALSRDFGTAMTRTGDSTVGIVRRYRFANSSKADALISVHGNAGGRLERGYMVIYSETSTAALESRRLAEHLGASLRRRGFAPSGRWRILLPFQEQWFLAASFVSNKIGYIMRDCRLGVFSNRQKRLGILDKSAVPAVIVEAGFLTHPRENQTLWIREFQAEFAEALAVGLVTYFRSE